MLFTILIVVLILALIGGLPTWGWWGPGWGYGPSGLALVLIVVVLLVYLARGHGLF